MNAARAGLVLLVLLLPGVMLAPVWQRGGLGANEDDILYYYPMRALFHDQVRAGQWPWLNPWCGLDRPFLADPQTAVLYPPTWLFAVLAPQPAYPAALWLHFALALWGMYRLLRSRRCRRPAAVFGAIVFAFGGFMLAHRAHFSIHNAAAWLPWVLWRMDRYVRSTRIPPRRRGPRQADPRRKTAARRGGGVGAGQTTAPRLLWASAALLMQCLAGHIQVVVLTAMASVSLMLADSRGQGRLRKPRVSRRAMAARWVGAWVAAGGLFAIQWLPTLEYARLCTRSDRTYRDFVENSWSPASLAGLVMPMLFGQRTPNFFDRPYWGPSHQVEQFAYVGILPLLLAAATLRRGGWADGRRRPWLVLGVLALLFALGELGPVCPVLFWLPGSNVLRCPARAVLLLNVALAALAAVVLDDLSRMPTPARAALRAWLLAFTRGPAIRGVLLVGAPWLAVALSSPFLNPQTRAEAWQALQPWRTAVWVPLVLSVLSFLALRGVVAAWQRPALVWTLSLVVCVDLGIIGWTIDVPRAVTAPGTLASDGEGAWMKPVRDSSQRLWVVNTRQRGAPGEYTDPLGKAVANTNILHGICSLTDYGPLQPQRFIERFGFEYWGEIKLPFDLLADTTWTRLYHVGWILLCGPDLPPPDMCVQVAATAAGYRLFRSPCAAERAVFANAAQPGAVRHDRAVPYRMQTIVDPWPGRQGEAGAAAGDSDSGLGSAGGQPGGPDPAEVRVVVSQIALPGWTARVAGRPLPIEAYDGVLMSVRVPADRVTTIDWTYFPPGLAFGAAISVASGVLLLLRSARVGGKKPSPRTGRRRAPAAKKLE